MILSSFRKTNLIFLKNFSIFIPIWLALTLYINKIKCSEDNKRCSLQFDIDYLLELINTINDGNSRCDEIFNKIYNCKELFHDHENNLKRDYVLKEILETYTKRCDYIKEKLKKDIEELKGDIKCITNRINEISRENYNNSKNKKIGDSSNESAECFYEIDPTNRDLFSRIANI